MCVCVCGGGRGQTLRFSTDALCYVYKQVSPCSLSYVCDLDRMYTYIVILCVIII